MKTSITLRLFQQYYFHQNIFLRFSIRLLVTQSGSPKKTPIKFFNKILIENIRNIKKYEIHEQDFSPKSFLRLSLRSSNVYKLST